MISTEIQRLILIAGLAAAGYLIMLAWNDDYGNSVAAIKATAAPELSQQNSAASDFDLPAPLTADVNTAVAGSGLSSAVADTESDIPDASLIAPAATGAAADQTGLGATTPVSKRLVKVYTDTLEIWIDLAGGDIVRTRLPKFPVTLDQPDEAFMLLDRSGGRTYIAQSGLIGPDGLDSGGSRPVFSSAASEYRFDGEAGVVTLQAQHNGVDVEKIYKFAPNDYLVDVSYRVVNTTANNFVASFFGQIKRDSKPVPGESSSTLGPQPYLGAAITTAESRYEKVEFEDLDDAPMRQSVEGGWIAMLQHYFLSAWIPNADDTNQVYGQPRSDGTYIIGYTGPAQQIVPGATGDWHGRFYAGPKDQDRLAEIAENLNLTVDYGFLWWLAVPLFKLLNFLHGLVGNWGLSIILMTVVVKAVLYPLSAASFKSMANMRRVAPQLKRLQERHADDRAKLSQEMMALYKKEKVSPLGGCLPMLLQMPVFLSLYWVLFESVELRQAPFFAWIHDLAAMDSFFVLPILMGASMFLQQSLNPPVPDPMQAKVMKFMPVMFTALFLFFPAGLVLYWLTNNVLSMTQQWIVIKQVEGAAKPST